MPAVILPPPPQPNDILPPSRASPNLLGSDTPLKFLSWRNLRRWRTPREAGSLRFPAETCLNGSRQTPLRAGGDESGKGKILPLAAQRNIGPAVKFSCVGLTVLSQ